MGVFSSFYPRGRFLELWNCLKWQFTNFKLEPIVEWCSQWKLSIWQWRVIHCLIHLKSPIWKLFLSVQHLNEDFVEKARAKWSICRFKIFATADFTQKQIDWELNQSIWLFSWSSCDRKTWRRKKALFEFYPDNLLTSLLGHLTQQARRPSSACLAVALKQSQLLLSLNYKSQT